MAARGKKAATAAAGRPAGAAAAAGQEPADGAGASKAAGAAGLSDLGPATPTQQPAQADGVMPALHDSANADGKADGAQAGGDTPGTDTQRAMGGDSTPAEEPASAGANADGQPEAGAIVAEAPAAEPAVGASAPAAGDAPALAQALGEALGLGGIPNIGEMILGQLRVLYGDAAHAVTRLELEASRPDDDLAASDGVAPAGTTLLTPSIVVTAKVARRRAGIAWQAKETRAFTFGELSADQLEALQADPGFAVEIAG